MTFQEWFEGFRLGLDFGPKGVGVAAVKGRRILFAQSLLNLSSVNVEKRREHRRSRRTHRQRQRRLRRFRKYCLSHGLPDPVPLAHTSKAPHPLLTSPNTPDPIWQEIAAIRNRLLAGRGTDQDFVRFCYDLCRRRGYTYDSLKETTRRALLPKRGKRPTRKEVEDILYKKFENAQIPAEDRQRIEQILRQEGYGELLEEGSVLLQTLNDAVNRPSDTRHPRVQRPREAVRKELEQVCQANPKYAQHEEPIWKIIHWQPRPLRIDNRASTMRKCSWCGKEWRPRLGNLAKDKDMDVREGLLWEAVHNLRHKRSAKAEAIPPWWQKSFAGEFKKKGVPPTDNLLKQVFDELKSIEVSEGRQVVSRTTSQVLKKHHLVETEAGKLADLLCPREKDEGRSKRCRACIKLGAKARTAEDWRAIRAMVLANRAAQKSQGKMEAWLDQCIKAIRKALFYKDPKGVLRCRYGNVVTIALEVPKFDPDEGKSAKRRLEANQQRREWPFLRQRWFQQGGMCIYCGLKHFTLDEEQRADGSIRYHLPAGFEEEHIFPRNEQFQGDDRQNNRVIACAECNRNLKERCTPWYWLKNRQEAWAQFETRVRECGRRGLPRVTQDLLLSQEAVYPDPSSLLTHSAQIRKVLAQKLTSLFKEARCVLTDQQIIFVDGATTQWVRREWRKIPGQGGILQPNFMEKDRNNPAHHAQDAALAASIPPHYLRRSGEWLRQAEESQGGRPDPRYSPDWLAYETASKRKPLSIDLTRRRFDWHARQWDDTIYGRDKQGRFFVRKTVTKAKPTQLPEGSEWAKEALGLGTVELTDPRTGKMVRAMKVYPDDVGATSMQEEKANSGRWRKTLLDRPWVALRKMNGQVELRLPKAGEARTKPSAADGWWTLERGNIVWLKKPEPRIVGGIPHLWPIGWYRLTKISGKGDGLTFEPCDHALPLRERKNNEKTKTKKEPGDLTLKVADLSKLRWPRHSLSPEG